MGLILAALCAPMALRWLVRTRLQAMIADQLDARLTMGDLKYSFPYEVNVSDASIVTDRPGGESLVLLQVPHLGLKLAKSPLRSGPLVIESIQIDNPAIHLVQTEKGLLGRRAPAAGAASQPTTDDKSSSKKDWKLSDMLRLHRLALHGGSAMYEDTSFTHTRPLLWQNLNIDLDTRAESVSSYGFHLIADNRPLAMLDAQGSADVDSLELRLSKCGLSVTVDPSSDHSALPPEYQKLLADLGIRGSLSINTSATLPLRDIQDKKFDTTVYDTTVDLRDARAAIPQLAGPIENVSAKVHLTSGHGMHAVQLASLSGKTAGVAMNISSGTATLDPVKLTWKLDKLAGRIDGASLAGSRLRGIVDFELNGSAPLFATDLNQLNGSLHIIPQSVIARPPDFAHDIDQFADMTLAVSKGILTAKQIRAGYGDDVWFIRQAEVDLTQLPKLAIINNAAGAITFGQRHTAYPKEIEKILAQANPTGPWFFELASAKVPLNDISKIDYHLAVHTARGQLLVNDGKIPVYNINTMIRLSPRLISIDSFDAGVLRGEVQAYGSFTPGNIPSYELDTTVRNLDLHDLLKALQPPSTTKPQTIAGRAFVKAHLAGTIPPNGADPLAAVTGAGNFEVRDGNFFQIPVMQAIEKDVNVKAATTVGQAAGVFTISRSTLHLNPVVVSSPVLGVDGSGDVGFKGQLALDMIAEPLGQWGEKLDAGEGASGVLTAVQKGLNVAARQALYNVHVGGTTDKPITTTKLAPFLTDRAGDLIGLIKKQGGEGGLLNFAQQHSTPPPASQPAMQGK